MERFIEWTIYKYRQRSNRWNDNWNKLQPQSKKWQQRNKEYGLDKDLPVLYYKEDNNSTSGRMALVVKNFEEKMMIKVRKDYFPDLDNIFHPTNPELPKVKEAVFEDQQDKSKKEAAQEKFKVDYKEQRDKKHS